MSGAAFPVVDNELVDHVVDHCGREVHALVVYGSLVEGIGNSRSDVDVVAVVDDVLPRLPTVLFVGRRRIDVLQESLAAIEVYAATANRCLDRDVGGPEEERELDLQLEFATRLTRGTVLSSDATWDAAARALDRVDIAGAVARRRLRSAVKTLWLAATCRVPPIDLQVDAAIDVIDAALAASGDDYFRQKWLFERLQRTGLPQLADHAAGLLRAAAAVDVNGVASITRAIFEEAALAGRSQSISVDLLDGTAVDNLPSSGALVTRKGHWGSHLSADEADALVALPLDVSFTVGAGPVGDPLEQVAARLCLAGVAWPRIDTVEEAL